MIVDIKDDILTVQVDTGEMFFFTREAARDLQRDLERILGSVEPSILPVPFPTYAELKEKK